MFDNISLSSVFLVTVLAFVMGWVWYSPLLFGNRWMKELGIKKPEKMTADIKRDMMRASVLGLCFTFLGNTVLAHFVSFMGLNTTGDALQLAFWVWLGFVLPQAMSLYLWEKRSLTLVAIGAGYYLMAYMLAGVIFVS